MKTVSTVALGAVLALGLAAAPAIAREKPAAAAPAAPQVNLSKPFRAAAGPLQAAVVAKNWPDAASKLGAAQAAATTPDDKFIAAQFAYQIATGTSDAPAQNAALEAMLASGGAPTALAAQVNYQLGSQAYFKRDYVKTATYLNEAIRLGYKPPELLIMAADAQFKQRQFAAGLAFGDQAIAAQKAANQTVPEDWYARLLGAAYNAKLSQQAVNYSVALVRAYPKPENWRSALVLYRDGKTLDPQTSLDLYRLMRLTKSVAGERDYFEYAALASERGLPGEAKSVVDEAFTTGKVPATSRPLTEIRTSAAAKITSDRASLAGLERSAMASGNARSAVGTGDAYLGYGDDAKAAALYRLALTKGGIDADIVNTRLGIALARSGDKAGARSAFTAVKGPRAELAAFWMLYLDQQTGA